MLKRTRSYVRAVAACTALFSAGIMIPASAEEGDYAKSSTGTRVLTLESGTEIKALFEAENFGGSEVDVVTFSFPPGTRRGDGHLHGAIEVFYVVSGTLIHTVNGEEHLLTPGMAGLVRPGDTVQHGVEGDEPATGIIVWAPGGEVERLAASGRFKVESLK